MAGRYQESFANFAEMKFAVSKHDSLMQVFSDVSQQP
jgi:hypothetical protein